MFSEEATLYVPGHLIRHYVKISGNLPEVTEGSRENSQTIFFRDLSQWKLFCFSNSAVDGAVFLGILEVILMTILEKRCPKYTLLQ